MNSAWVLLLPACLPFSGSPFFCVEFCLPLPFLPFWDFWVGTDACHCRRHLPFWVRSAATACGLVHHRWVTGSGSPFLPALPACCRCGLTGLGSAPLHLHRYCLPACLGLPGCVLLSLDTCRSAADDLPGGCDTCVHHRYTALRSTRLPLGLRHCHRHRRFWN